MMYAVYDVVIRAKASGHIGYKGNSFSKYKMLDYGADMVSAITASAL